MGETFLRDGEELSQTAGEGDDIEGGEFRHDPPHSVFFGL